MPPVRQTAIKVKEHPAARSTESAGHRDCVRTGNAGPIAIGEEEGLDLLKNEASFQDAIFGVTSLLAAKSGLVAAHADSHLLCVEEDTVQLLNSAHSHAGVVHDLQGEADQLLEIWSCCDTIGCSSGGNSNSLTGLTTKLF